MALYQGDNVAVSVAQRTVINSGTNPALFPAPPDFEGAFDGGQILVDRLSHLTFLYLCGPLYEPSVGPGRQGYQIIELAQSLDAGEFRRQDNGLPRRVPVIFGGTVPADIAAVTSPVMTLGQSTTTGGQVSGVGGLFSLRPSLRTTAGANATQDCAWMVFELLEGASAPSPQPAIQRTSDMTIRVDSHSVDAVMLGPAVAKSGRLDVTEVRVFGTLPPGVVRLARDVDVELTRPVRGRIEVTGNLIMSGLEDADLDGEWTMDDATWTLATAEAIDRGSATVRLTKRTGA